MTKRSIFKLPVIENTFVLEYKFPVSEEKENEKVLKDNAQESYQKGWNDALKSNQENVELLCQSLKKIITDLTQEKNNIMGKCEKEIIKLAIAIAKKTVHEEISQNSGKIIESVVKDALNKVKDNKILKIHLNPDDVEQLEQVRATGMPSGGEDYEVVSDADISRGGCRVITDYGGVDARIETRWNEIFSAFEEHDLKREESECQK